MLKMEFNHYYYYFLCEYTCACVCMLVYRDFHDDGSGVVERERQCVSRNFFFFLNGSKEN